MGLLNKFGLKNFRVFKDQTDFDFAPITIFTGKNSSGKSSVLKALQLLKDNIGNQNHLKKIATLDFQSSVHNLGNFYLVKRLKDESILFSLPFGFVDTLCLEYNESNTPLKNGSLRKLSIYNNEVKWLTIDSIESQGFCYYINFNNLYQSFKESSNNPLCKYTFIEGVQANEKNNLILSFEKEYLNLISERFIQYYPDDIDDSSCFILEYLLREHFYYPGTVHSHPFNLLLKKHKIKTAESNQNGIEYFEKIKDKIRSGFSLLSHSLSQLKYISSTRGNQSRIHLDGNTSEFNSIILQYLSSISTDSDDEIQFLNKWLTTFELLSKSETFEVKRVEAVGSTLILKSKTGEKELNLADLGFGISQLVAILLSIVSGHSWGTTIYIEEPEANLHPNFQSLLADMFVDANKIFGIWFILESHSEYLIRKLQLLTARDVIATKDSVIYYFEKGLTNKIEITSDGRLTKDFGTGFVDEATKIIFDLWKVQGLN